METGTMAAAELCLQWKRNLERGGWKLLERDGACAAADKSGASVTVTDEDGLNSQTLYQDSSSGSWVNEAGGIYTDNGDGSFTGPDGNLWYS